LMTQLVEAVAIVLQTALHLKMQVIGLQQILQAGVAAFVQGISHAFDLMGDFLALSG
jgi:hypothetical protein